MSLILILSLGFGTTTNRDVIEFPDRFEAHFTTGTVGADIWRITILKDAEVLASAGGTEATNYAFQTNQKVIVIIPKVRK